MARSPLDLALAAVPAKARAALALCREWVLINSFTTNVDGVNAVGAKLAEAFALPGLTVTRVAGGPAHGDHVVAETAAASAPGARPILLIGHHDTVFPPGTFDGWRETDDGKVVGPGVLDMKGGLAVIWAALAALGDAGLLAALPLVVISVSDEEIGSPSSASLLAQRAAGAAAALVFESGRQNDAIVTRRKGTGALRVVMRGRAAHAGNDHARGVNAIWALARFIDAAQALTDAPRGVTVNVGTITGGTSKNTVPEHAECAVDVRFERAADADALVAALHDAARGAAASVPGCVASVSGGVQRPPLEAIDGQAALFARYAAAARAEGLGADEAALQGGGSDANTVSAVGVPAIDGLGPRGAGFHTTSEWIDLASFASKVAALVRVLAAGATAPAA